MCTYVIVVITEKVVSEVVCGVEGVTTLTTAVQHYVMTPYKAKHLQEGEAHAAHSKTYPASHLRVGYDVPGEHITRHSNHHLVIYVSFLIVN